MKKTLLLVAGSMLLICQPVLAESLLKKLLRITGISATPSQQKAPGEEMEAGGQIWIANLKTGAVRKLSEEGGFRSPIFAPNDNAVLALKDRTLYRTSLEAGTATRLHENLRLTKLVGTDRDDSDKILVLIDRNSKVVPALLSLASGAISEIPYDPDSSDDRRLLNHLKGWERVYGATKVYPKAQTREGIAGTVEWQDVFLSKVDAAPVNISRCDGANCGQPSLSRDETKVVFIRAQD